MSRSAMPATRNEATRHVKPPKMTTSAELTIGTAIRESRGQLRTVANGCGHKRDVERPHPQPPDPQSETGTLATHSGKIVIFAASTSILSLVIFSNFSVSQAAVSQKTMLEAAMSGLARSADLQRALALLNDSFHRQVQVSGVARSCLVDSQLR